MIAKLASTYGHRGVWLMTMGTIWLVFGVGALVGGPTVPDRPWVAHDLIPQQVQAAAWILTGGAAAWIGHQGPRTRDWIGHVALYIVPAVWTASFTASYAIWLATSLVAAAGWMAAPVGYDRGWYSALIWSVIVVMIRLVSSWANPAPAVIPHPRAELDRSRDPEGRHAG